jgi:NAD(P)-dependent dehydrogenase (short-subunit alcohol dehydrogenase family)
LKFDGNSMTASQETADRTALITGASRGLGRALAAALNDRGWRLVVDGRDGHRLATAVAALPRPDRVTAVTGDVTDPAHRAALADAAGPFLSLLVNNASDLGPSPLPRLADLSPERLQQIVAVNTVAPLALVQAVLPALRSATGRVLDISSDAAVEAYAGWGGYGASKAALDQLTAVLAVEHPELRVYAVDPGDMATDMQQAAFPGEDISDRPPPETVVPALLTLVDGERPSGRYRVVASLQGPAASVRASGGREVLSLVPADAGR